MKATDQTRQARPGESRGHPSPSPPAGQFEKRRLWGMCLLLAAVVFFAFSAAFKCDFINYDDDQYFSANPHVQAGLSWSGVTWAFRTGYASNWHPLTWLSLMLDAEVFGPGPLGPHLSNVVFHAANAALLFLLLARLTGAFWRSAWVAAMFALHPLHVESVAWIAERKDVLSAFFGLLALLMYARYVQKSARCQAPGVREGGALIGLWSLDFGLSVLFFALSLMSKPMLVTLPFVMLLLDLWPLRRRQPSTPQLGEAKRRWLNPSARRSEAEMAQPLGSAKRSGDGSTFRRLVVEKLPFLALSVASSIVTLVVQREAVHPLAHISVSLRAANALVSYYRYLAKTIWPAHLAIPYPHPGYWPLNLICAAVVLIAGLSVAVWVWRRKMPFLMVGWLWYLGMLLPTIGLVQVGMQSMADRYTYLPLVGVFIMLAWGAPALAEELRVTWGRAAVVTGAVLVLAACAVRTRDQVRLWRNSETLFRHSIDITKNNEIASYNLGEYYFGQGRLDEAIDSYRRAVQIRPDYDDALNNLGVALAQKGNFDEGIANIQAAIRIRPDKADACYNLGNAYILQRKLDEAAQAYLDALRLKPDYPEAHNNLANIYAIKGQRDLAIQHYQAALRLNPSHEGAKRGLRMLGVP